MRTYAIHPSTDRQPIIPEHWLFSWISSVRRARAGGAPSLGSTPPSPQPGVFILLGSSSFARRSNLLLQLLHVLKVDNSRTARRRRTPGGGTQPRGTPWQRLSPASLSHGQPARKGPVWPAWKPRSPWAARVRPPNVR